MCRLRTTLALLAALAGTARADHDDRKRAKQLYELGVIAVRDGRYEEALAAFEDANDLAPAPRLLFNIGQTYRLMGECARARDAYRAYLRAEPDAPNRDKVEERVEAMQTCASETPAKPVLVASADDDEAPRATLSAASAASTVMRSDEDKARGRPKKALGLSAAILGASAAGAGIYFSMRASDAQSSLDRFYAAGGTWNATYANLEERRDSAKRSATYLYASSGALLVSGALLYYLGWQESLSVSVTPRSGGGQLGVAGEF